MFIVCMFTEQQQQQPSVLRRILRMIPPCPILPHLVAAASVYNGILTLLNKALTQASTYYLWNDFIIPRIVHKFKSILSLK